tara:strand:- start:1114 stop:1413 length:300 start_codon:yes stop_codon:yes gene_type:complete
MLRKFFVLLILLLIVSTTFVKNHTKKLDEEIFSIEENINYLNSVHELVKLEFNYLSSPEKLLELNFIYFDNQLKHTLRENIKIIDNSDQINFKILELNE